MQEIDNIMLDFINELGYDEVKHMFLRVSSGKKLRSKLLLKIADENENSLRLCAIIELIHLASLLHDDVIDDADTRRSEPSINALFGTKNAIMLGDILYSKGFYELSKFGLKISQTISQAVNLLSIGELMDVRLSGEFNTNKDVYMQMIYNKTAVLIEASAVCGAMLSSKNEDNFRVYGKNLGLAFQIIDDVLDVTQDSKKLGKPALNDFIEGKMTLPYLYLYDSLDDNGKNRLKSLHKRVLSDEDSNWIMQSFKNSDAIIKSVNYAKELGAMALDSIKEYKNSDLENIIVSMIDRDF